MSLAASLGDLAARAAVDESARLLLWAECQAVARSLTARGYTAEEIASWSGTSVEQVIAWRFADG